MVFVMADVEVYNETYVCVSVCGWVGEWVSEWVSRCMRVYVCLAFMLTSNKRRIEMLNRRK